MVLGKIIPSYQKNYLQLYIAEDSLHANIIATNHSAKTWQIRETFKKIKDLMGTHQVLFSLHSYPILCFIS